MSEYRNNNGRYGGSSSGRYSFEEGYTSADNRGGRAPQRTGGSYGGRDTRSASSGQRLQGGQRADSGYGGRFIDAGDRYMYSFENEVSEQTESRGAQPAERYADSGYAPTGRFDDGYAPTGRYADDYPADRYAQPADRRGGYQGDEYYPGERRQALQEQEYYGQQVRRSRQPEYEYDDYDYDLAEDNRSYAPQRGERVPQRAPQRTGQRSDRTGQYADRTGTRGYQPAQRAYGTRQAAPQRGRAGGGLFAWLNSLTSQQMTWLMVGGAVLLVLIILALCLILQSDGCQGCSGDDTEIPVIEQGDGNEIPGGYTDIVPDEPDEVVSTSDGMVTIDEEIETDDIIVEVTDANGTYGRTGVHRAEAATLVITDQNNTGFAFSLEVKAEGVMGTLSGYAYFCAAKEAVYEGAQGLLNFSFGKNGITVYQTDIISAFEDVQPDGVYISGTPTYIEDEAEQSQELGLDANIRSSEAVRNALTGLLSENDMVLIDFIFAHGTERVFEGSEKGYDMNGTAINIDAELGAVKYYAFINGTGEEVILICTNDAKVYVGVCDGASYRYYTNDPAYSETAPKAITGQAKGKGMELTYVPAPAEQ